MHIVHLETGRHLYGGGRQVLMLLEGLASAGVNVSLVCPDNSAIATAADGGHVNIVTTPMRGELDAVFGVRLGRWLSESNADLLHVHSRRGADLWGGLAARRARMPAVLTRRVDNPEPPLAGAFKYRMYKRVIAISAAIREQVAADGARSDDVRLVHSAIQADACKPAWGRQQFLDAFGFAPDSKVVVCVAQFIPRKGHADLLAAWPEIVRAQPDARLLLLGQGADEDRLRERVSADGLGDSVQFAGYRADLREFLGCADLLVHPAHREGLGVCLLEAQAAGLPVVATTAGGIPEAVRADETGLLVPPEDRVALGNAIVRLLDDQALRKRMAAAGPAYMRAEFSPAGMVSGNLSVYKELLRT